MQSNVNIHERVEAALKAAHDVFPATVTADAEAQNQAVLTLCELGALRTKWADPDAAEVLLLHALDYSLELGHTVEAPNGVVSLLASVYLTTNRYYDAQQLYEAAIEAWKGRYDALAGGADSAPAFVVPAAIAKKIAMLKPVAP